MHRLHWPSPSVASTVRSLLLSECSSPSCFSFYFPLYQGESTLLKKATQQGSVHWKPIKSQLSTSVHTQQNLGFSAQSYIYHQSQPFKPSPISSDIWSPCISFYLALYFSMKIEAISSVDGLHTNLPISEPNLSFFPAKREELSLPLVRSNPSFGFYPLTTYSQKDPFH